MRFVRIELLAGELRAKKFADALGVPCEYKWTGGEAGEWVVFVKAWDGLAEAKAAGCRIAFDPIDFFCYDDGRDKTTPTPEVDVVILPAKSLMDKYKPLFPNADYIVIPHQWDDRIVGTALQDEFRPGYVGRKFNLREHLNIPRVLDDDEQLAALPRFNCHCAEYWSHFKPATKVASAAAVGANIVVHKNAAAHELLGDEYPFWAETTIFDGLWQAKKAFGTQAWRDGLAIMEQVKKRTSFEETLKRYEVFL